jgi:type I restriction enzyme R subunit
VFSEKVHLMLELQDTKHQSVAWRAGLRKRLAKDVLAQVVHLREQLSRISVRKVLPHLDKFRTEEALNLLTEEKVKEIDRYITPLAEDLAHEAELVKLFDCHMFAIELSLANTDSCGGAAAEVGKVRKVAQRLKRLGTIADVVARSAELEQLVSADFWDKATLERVDELRQLVRGLMVYLQTDSVGIVTLHISDESAELPADTGILDIRTYREKVIDYLSEHILSPVVEKIRRLEPIGQKDMAELENILWHVLGTKEQYEAEKYKGSLPGFVRSLVDIDEDAVQEKFGEFLSGGRLNQDQQEFVREIVDYLRENGEVTADDLTNDEPFANYDITNLFADRMDQLRELLKRISEIDAGSAA